MNAYDYDVIIVGAGPVGNACAVALQSSNLRVAVLDRDSGTAAPPRTDWDARVYAISPASAGFLDRLGIWKRLDAARMGKFLEIEVFGDDGVSSIHFDAYDVGRSELAWTVENRALQAALQQALDEAGSVARMYSAAIQHIEWTEQGGAITLADGKRLSAALIIGADGGDSRVRAAAAIPVHTHNYRQCGIVANFRAEKFHGGVARQWFLNDGIMAWLPLPDNLISIVWALDEAKAATMLAAAPEVFTDAVAMAGFDTLGGLELVTPAADFPLRYLRVEQSVKPGMALIGDAAHVVHPLAGQGVNLGLQDAEVLADTLSLRGPAPCGDYALLRRYERARREPIVAMQTMTDGLQRLFAVRHPAVKWLRNAGLALTDRQTLLKHFFTAQALGENRI